MTDHSITVEWAVLWPEAWNVVAEWQYRPHVEIPLMRPGFTHVATFDTEAEARAALALLATEAKGNA